MQINSIQNNSFGQIFASQQIKKKIKKLYWAIPEDERPNKITFQKNWNHCLDTKEFDILITDDNKVYLLDKNGQKVMREALHKNFVWNIDSALKRVQLFENAMTHENNAVSKYE